MDEGCDAVSHFLSGLVGECKAEYVGRVNAEFIDNVGVSVCQCLGLPGTGSGNHPYPSLGAGDCLPLSRIQIVQKFHCNKCCLK